MLSTRRRFFQTTCSPATAGLRAPALFPAIVITDSTPPTQPGTPVGTAVSTSQINWTWTASTDSGGSGFAGYRIYVDDAVTPTTTVTTNSYSSTGHSASTTHTLRVEAYDNAGNSVSGGTGSQTTQAASSGQLAAGYFQSSVGTFWSTMYPVYPRPDAETGTYARHRWAYYDGVNPMLYEIDIGVQFGAWPYWYELIAGPPGMSVGQLYTGTDYGKVRWTPSGAVSNQTVTVRVHDQDGNTLDVTWTVSTTSSTSQFIFVSTSGNDTTGTGAISAPFATLGKVFNTNTYPNRIVVLRAGTYNAAASNATYGMGLGVGQTPMAVMAFPGETVTINAATGGAQCVFNSGSGDHDVFLKDLNFSGHPTNAQYYTSFNGGLMHRFSAFNLNVPNAYGGTVTNENCTMLYFDSPQTGAYRNHVFIHGCTETNRSGAGGSNYGITVHFCSKYVLVQSCSAIGSTGDGDIYLKASCSNSEVRECYVKRITDGSITMGTGSQIDTGLANENILYRHCRASSSAGGVSIFLNREVDGAQLNRAQDVVRCNCVGAVTVNWDEAGRNMAGPFRVINCVIQTSNNLVMASYANGALGAHTVSSGNIGGASGYLDATTLNLTATQSAQLGLKGAQIKYS